MNSIIIPAYEPDLLMISLIDEIKKVSSLPIIVVNDGSSRPKKVLFDEAKQKGCHVIHHPQNQGKGAAIKTGIEYASHLDNITGYITVDADGQHAVSDILQLDATLIQNPEAFVLGVRRFNGKDVPVKSRFGNWFSRLYMKTNTGRNIEDTQTGLRGIPKSLTLDALSIIENHYDYEMNFLMKIAKSNINIIQVPIKTIYLDDNSSSHFNPIVDSIRIYKQPIKFAISSLTSALLDISIFTIMTLVLDKSIFILVLLSTVIARITSGGYNFMLNRVWSFQSFHSIRTQFKRYLMLYLVQLSLSVLFVYLLSFMTMHLTLAKVIVDGTLFVGSYFIQKHWVFHKENANNKQYKKDLNQVI